MDERNCRIQKKDREKRREMNLSLKEFVKIYTMMQKRGVVLYGAGREGLLALETLENEGITVSKIADKQVGKAVGTRLAVSLEEICKSKGEEVCIVTPMQSIPSVTDKLRDYYEVVIDNFIVHWIAFFTPTDFDNLNYMSCFPFNHYESPFCQSREFEIFRGQKINETDHINLNVDQQFKFVPQLVTYGKDFSESMGEPGFRYKSDNLYFCIGDALLLHSMIRANHPKRIIEVGSGFSTCVMLDTKEYWADCNDIKITCIEPYPERLISSIKNTDQVDVKREFVQSIDRSVFDSLGENDILFIDSSHVVKAGGDILYEYFEILPRLRPGVLIHIHDIFYPFTYPEEWILQGRPYNEAYILRALLTDTNAYEVVFWNHFILERYAGQLAEKGLNENMLSGGSIWLRKC